MRSILSILLSVLLWACAGTGAGVGGDRPSPRRGETAYTLHIVENREESRETRHLSDVSRFTVDSEMTIYGNLRRGVDNDRHTVTLGVDSIWFVNKEPYDFWTFMSSDTMYYDSQGGRSTINRSAIPQYDSMLACIFNGPAVHAVFSSDGSLDSLVHLKENCKSGEYDRINIPVTVEALILSPPQPVTEKQRWTEQKAMPSFSGVGFYPRLRFEYRVVQIDNGSTTVVISADSTVIEHRIRMKNGEEAVILTDEVHVGGTFDIGDEPGSIRSGELRIREHMQLLRPQVSHGIVTKTCQYKILFTSR